MPKKRRRRTHGDETMQRNVAIASIAPQSSFSVKGEKDGEPEFDGHQGPELPGQMIEPIRDVHDVVFNLWADPDNVLVRHAPSAPPTS